MAYIQPNTVVKLYAGVNITRDYDHTVYFDKSASGISQQQAYFNNYLKKTFSPQTYQRAGKNVIRVAELADNLYDCNYMSFQNTNFGSKWFYAFIDKVEYINNNTSELTYTIDLIQTYWENWEFGNGCIIEREHTATDIIGDHTLDEGFNCNLKLLNNHKLVRLADNNENTQGIIVAYVPNTKKITGLHSSGANIWSVEGINFSAPVAEYWRGNIIAGFLTFHFTGDTKAELQSKLGSIILYLENDNAEILSITRTLSSIMTAYYTAQETSPYSTPYISDYLTEGNGFIFQYNDYLPYIPKNKKLYTFPYRSINITNLNGQNLEYKWEQSSAREVGTNFPQISVNCYYDLVPQIIYKIVPVGYQNQSLYYNATITETIDDINNYSVDSLTEWWAENKNNFLVGIVKSIVNGVVSQNIMTHVNEGFNIAQDIGNAIIKSNEIYGTVKNDIITAQLNIVGFEIQDVAISGEMAKSIDNYFTKYGYKVMRMGTPNFITNTRRPYWNYIKCTKCDIHHKSVTYNGYTLRGLTAEDEENIEKIFENGITFWNSTTEIGDYNHDNSPVT